VRGAHLSWSFAMQDGGVYFVCPAPRSRCKRGKLKQAVPAHHKTGLASMWKSLSGAVTGAVTAALLLLNPPPRCGRDGAFCPDACDRMRRYVPQELVGQGFALQQLMDAVCDHLAEDSPTRPLVLSLHGPPGVGKTLFHRLLAQAVYNATDGATVRALLCATCCTALRSPHAATSLRARARGS
jgi:hypothetical protein